MATTTMSAHKIRERTPSTISRVNGPEPTAAATASRNA